MVHISKHSNEHLFKTLIEQCKSETKFDHISGLFNRKDLFKPHVVYVSLKCKTVFSKLFKLLTNTN